MNLQSNNGLSIPMRLVRILGIAVILLMIPLLGTLLNLGANWGPGDFAIMGALLIGAGVAYEISSTLIARKHRILAAIFILIVLALVWGELAVGIFGSPIAGD